MYHNTLNIVAIIAVLAGLYYCLFPFLRNATDYITGNVSDEKMYMISSHLFLMAIAIWVGTWFNLNLKETGV